MCDAISSTLTRVWLYSMYVHVRASIFALCMTSLCTHIPQYAGRVCSHSQVLPQFSALPSLPTLLITSGDAQLGEKVNPPPATCTCAVTNDDLTLCTLIIIIS